MFVRALQDCPAFIAGDGTVLREVFHPDKAGLALRYSLAHAIVPVGEASLPHRLKTAEVYYLLTGEGDMYIDDEVAPVCAGDTVYIPPHATQWIRNTGSEELAFLCIVDPAWQAEDEEVL